MFKCRQCQRRFGVTDGGTPSVLQTEWVRHCPQCGGGDLQHPPVRVMGLTAADKDVQEAAERGFGQTTTKEDKPAHP